MKSICDPIKINVPKRKGTRRDFWISEKCLQIVVSQQTSPNAQNGDEYAMGMVEMTSPAEYAKSNHPECEEGSLNPRASKRKGMKGIMTA